MIKRLFFDSAAIFLVFVLTFQLSCGKSPNEPTNQPPTIISLTANPINLDWGGTSQLIVRATDPDGSAVSTNWEGSSGTFLTETNQDTVIWQAPDSSGSFVCMVNVSDGEDVTSQSITIAVSEHPILSKDQVSLIFATNTTSQGFTISNIGTGFLDWTTTASTDDGGNWIGKVHPSEGSLAANDSETITVEIDRTGLGGNRYSGLIRVATDAGDDSLQIIMDVAELAVSDESLDFGTASTDKSILVKNIGAGDLTWSITENISWLSASPPTGITDSQQNVNISVARPGLSPGTYSESFVVESNGGNKTVTVNMTVETPKNVTGRWEQKFNLGGTDFTGYYNLVQNGSTLTGDFVFSDGSGYTILSSRSYIRGTSINMAWWLQSFFIESKGTVSSSWNSMSGTMFANGTAISTWTATRISNSVTQATVSITTSDTSIAERFNQTLVNSVE